ncbi:hypothetical protein AB751O23_BA_00020 [Chlamydiales bacterium SCGC AB-751-O23]|jgi:hypothetical protein|nr:hypothetical protein AB751O23_BA_00020 [Chlamydiales bacterium SCGC AB-751-O23]
MIKLSELIFVDSGHSKEQGITEEQSKKLEVYTQFFKKLGHLNPSLVAEDQVNRELDGKVNGGAFVREHKLYKYTFDPKVSEVVLSCITLMQNRAN